MTSSNLAVMLVAPTVMASCTSAGATPHAEMREFPAGPHHPPHSSDRNHKAQTTWMEFSDEKCSAFKPFICAVIYMAAAISCMQSFTRQTQLTRKIRVVRWGQRLFKSSSYTMQFLITHNYQFQ